MSEYVYGTDGHEGHWLTGEEIIRCRDCTWLVETSNPISSTGWWCVQNDTPRSLDGFCDWGERRNDTEYDMEVE